MTCFIGPVYHHNTSLLYVFPNKLLVYVPISQKRPYHVYSIPHLTHAIHHRYNSLTPNASIIPVNLNIGVNHRY